MDASAAPVPVCAGPLGPATLLPSLRLVVGLPIAGEDDAGRAIGLALALLDALDGIAADVEPELQLALAIQRGVAVVTRRRASREVAFELEGSTAAFAVRLALSRLASGR